MSYHVLVVETSHLIRLRSEQRRTTDRFVERIRNTGADIQNTEFHNLERDDVRRDRLTEYTGYLSLLGKAMGDMRDLGMDTAFTNEFMEDIATTLRHTNRFSCNEGVRRGAVEVFGTLLTSEQRREFLTMNLFPVIVDPIPSNEDPSVPLAARGANFDITNMISTGSANYEALRERLESLIEMTELFMGIREGEVAQAEEGNQNEAIEIDDE